MTGSLPLKKKLAQRLQPGPRGYPRDGRERGKIEDRICRSARLLRVFGGRDGLDAAGQVRAAHGFGGQFAPARLARVGQMEDARRLLSSKASEFAARSGV